jgi:hypothetical protein
VQSGSGIGKVITEDSFASRLPSSPQADERGKHLEEMGCYRVFNPVDPWDLMDWDQNPTKADEATSNPGKSRV